MIKITDIKTALDAFEEAAANHAIATEEGDYKTGNKLYKSIVKAVTFLKKEDAVIELKQFLSHTSVGVRMWSASYLLPVDEKEGERVLKEIANEAGIHSFTADTTLSEWKKGNLNF